MISIDDRLEIMRETGRWPHEKEVEFVIPDHDNPAIELEFNAKICPACGVPFIMNKNRGNIDEDRNIDGFHKVCPLCGMCPY